MGRQDEMVKERMKKIEELRKAKINPYPNKYESKDKSSELQEKHAKLKPESHTKDSVEIAGRLMVFRDMGKIAFGTLDDGHGKIQIVLQDKDTPDKVMDFFKKYIDSGDFIGVQGTIFRTKRGELSILVKKTELLSKSILPLPEKWHGLQDEEEKLRKRYLDILMNPEVKQMFIRKSKFWNAIRSFLIKREFLEVETPVLENSAGGASATPFATHHNALDVDVFLRISMGELWQKKLMVAGYPKTFEIGRQFRNEGMDAEHLQDYTQMEFYWAYANYEDGMELVEEMYKKVAKEVYGKTKFKINDMEFDLADKWKRIDYSETVKKMTGIDVFKATEREMEAKLKELKVEHDKNASRSTLIDSLWKYCRKKIAGPAFLVGTPVEVSPLAKRDPKDSRIVERFQPILAGSEVGNGYSELNDPIDQEERFKEQQEMKNAGDAEAQSHDVEFVEALKYGMPPTCGFGVSERLFSFLEGKTIRETVIFPLMKPLKVDTPKERSEHEKTEKSTSSNPHITLPEGITRESAVKLLYDNVTSPSLRNHCLCVGASMKAYAKKFGANQEAWEIAGILHDFDYEKHPDKHPMPAVEILKKKGYPEDIIHAILSHAYERTHVARSTLIDRALFAVDELSGFVVAVSKVRADKFETMDSNSVEKALKKKGFAAAINRADVEAGAKELNVDRKEHFQTVIEALREFSKKEGKNE